MEALLWVTNPNMPWATHAVKDNAGAIFPWDYEKGERPKLNRLYEKAKTAMWNGETDLPWHLEVDQEKQVMDNAMNQGGLNAGLDLTGTPFGKRADKE